MATHEKDFFELVYGKSRRQRFTQDSPILPDVFIHYGESKDKRCDLLLTPHWSKTPTELSEVLAERLQGKLRSSRSDPGLAHNQTVVVAELSFVDLVCGVLPLSSWWQRWLTTLNGLDPVAACANPRLKRIMREELAQGLDYVINDKPLHELETRHWTIRPSMVWAARLFFNVQHARPTKTAGIKGPKDDATKIADYFIDEFIARMTAHREHESVDSRGESYLFSVNRNREIEATISDSVATTKADAAARTFDVTGEHICWAIIDSGIDARHIAFRRRDAEDRAHSRPFDSGHGGNHTRVRATYDFSSIRKDLAADQRRSLKSKTGRLLDWEEIERSLKLRVDHTAAAYRSPEDPHGTHVAGILGADWRPDPEAVDPLGPTPPSTGPDEVLQGVCPEISFYDLRVFDSQGRGDEFAVMSALQFVRSLNQRHDSLQIHGVNLSLAMHHDVSNYACGRSPVCEECTRLVGNGVVVVAAAGNEGRSIHTTTQGHRQEGYRHVSIADPGNAEAVLTVGSTHRIEPHTYGVSYFSSRGPTGDGRRKPDLVAPGEKIVSTVPGDRLDRQDGTSQAAPHVSGAAALLMSRHSELVGDPIRIKEILMRTATDLGRDQDFQGAGLVDVMRAIQSI